MTWPAMTRRPMRRNRLSTSRSERQRADDDTGVGDATGHHDVGTGSSGIPRFPMHRGMRLPSAGCRGRVRLPCRGGRRRPRRRSSRRNRASPNASTSPRGLSPPALATIFTPLSSASPRQSSACRRKVLAVATGRVLHSVASEDEHGQLGEVVTGEVVEVSSFEHLPHRGQSISVETGAVAYTYGHAFSRPACLVPVREGLRRLGRW